MGRNNSSKCRVSPFMYYMMADMERLAAFLAGMGISVSSRELEDAQICFDGHNGKKVFGFYIVAENFPEIEKLDKHSFTEKLEDQFGIGEWKTRIDDAYMGYTTWESITAKYPDLKTADGWKDSAE